MSNLQLSAPCVDKMSDSYLLPIGNGAKNSVSFLTTRYIEASVMPTDDLRTSKSDRIVDACRVARLTETLDSAHRSVAVQMQDSAVAT